MHDAARSQGALSDVNAPGIRELPFFECSAIQRNFVVGATLPRPGLERRNVRRAHNMLLDTPDSVDRFCGDA